VKTTKFERIRPAIASFSYPGDKEEIMIQLKIIAAREKKFQSDIIFELIEEFVKNHAEGNSTFQLDKWSEDPNFQAVPTIHADREKWISHYKDSNREDRVKLNIKINDLQKVFKMIEVNENRK